MLILRYNHSLLLQPFSFVILAIRPSNSNRQWMSEEEDILLFWSLTSLIFSGRFVFYFLSIVCTSLHFLRYIIYETLF